MSSSTLRSSIRRASNGGAVSSTPRQHQRSRSLTRYAGGELSTPRGKFVNKTRGSCLPEISLDDLADEFFRARAESDEESEASARRFDRRRSGASYLMETEASRRRRGRSVSRPQVSADGGSGGLESSARRRSISIARKPFSDYENDVDASAFSNGSKSTTSSGGKFQQFSLNKTLHNSGGLRRSVSQRNFFRSYESFSSHSSITDDEARDSHSEKCGIEKTIQTVYTSEKADVPVGDEDGIGLYEAMRKEVRCAVEEIKTELEKVILKREPVPIVCDDVKPKVASGLEAITEIRRNYTSKLEQSEKRRQELLTQLAVEEECGQELSKILKEFLPSPKKYASNGQTRPRRRSNDRKKISKRLTEEAEKYFEDFLSNVEDTDLSSFDGERSDTNSSIRERELHNHQIESNQFVSKAAQLTHDVDGILLPWLEWETSSDLSPESKLEVECCTPSGNNLIVAAQDASIGISNSGGQASCTDSCSPKQNASSSIPREQNESGMTYELSSSTANKVKFFSFDMEEYLSLQRSEDLLFEMLKQRHRIDSGGMILCGRTLI